MATELTNTERDRLRKLQDEFLGLSIVKRWTCRHGEDAPLFRADGPTVADVRTKLLPEWADRISHFIRVEGD